MMIDVLKLLLSLYIIYLFERQRGDYLGEKKTQQGTHCSGFMAGKSRTSLMLLESLSNMVSLSIPIPQPPVGGRPYSRDSTKFWSIA